MSRDRLTNIALPLIGTLIDCRIDELRRHSLFATPAESIEKRNVA
jgi:hypothetical protein